LPKKQLRFKKLEYFFKAFEKSTYSKYWFWLSCFKIYFGGVYSGAANETKVNVISIHSEHIDATTSKKSF
jgi:hypothetical protein